jgi:hypothetical protein
VHRYFLIVLIALSSTLQIALNMRMSDFYYVDSNYMIKKALMVQEGHPEY